ncbi:MAG: hypothetical protein M1438_09380 [Deltaproteobacteria bacterium]|nr:hypothetical protein [Deltaproteobacteria bacterium]
MRTVILCLFLFLVGCAQTLPEIRASNPDTVITSARSPKSMANCLNHEVQSESWGRINLTEDGENYHLLISSISGSGFTGGTKTFPVAEVLIKPDGNGGSIAEKRTWNLINKTASETLSESIQKCAQNIP